MPGCKVKICGVKREEDVEMVAQSGADYLGLLVDMPSPRTLDKERAAHLMKLSQIPVILLFFDKPAGQVIAIANELRPHGIQLQGRESCDDVSRIRAGISCEIWKGLHLPEKGTAEVQVQEIISAMNEYQIAGADKILLDTMVKRAAGEQRGGTGKTFDWRVAAEIASLYPGPIVLAGGLTPDNVSEAIDIVHPAVVDLASGVESAPGVKDPARVAAFMREVRKADLFYE